MCVPPYSPLSSFNKGSLGKLREGEVEGEKEEGGGGTHTFIRKGEEGGKEKGEPGNRVIDFVTLSTEPSISRLQ